MTEDQAGRERFKIMERKLYRGIMTPCMVLTLVFGAWMLYFYPGFIQTGWMQAKIALVVLVVIYHHMCLYHMKQFREDRNTHSHVYFRWFNEAPTVVLLLIIILVVVKPF
jgi:putative membrane protein